MNMWDPRWLSNKSFWTEAGLFILFILVFVTVAIVKPTLPGVTGSPTPTTGPIPTIFYYSETDTTSSTTRVWKSTTSDVNARSEIAIFSHAPGSLPTGKLSPDGSRIGLIITPEDAGDVTTGELWLLTTDGTYFQRATKENYSWFGWKQDGQALALFSQTTVSNPSSQPMSVETTLSKLNLSTGETSVILFEDSVVDAKPLGWSAGGDEFVMMTLSSTGKWLVSSIIMESGSQVGRFSLPDNDLLRNAWLSPNGAYLLVDIIRNEKAILMLFSLDGKQQVEIASIGIGLYSDPTSFAAVWSPDGQHLLINQPSAGSSSTTWKTVDLQGGADTPVYLGEVDPNHYLRPLDWSLDGNWLAMAESPFPYARIYIKEISASDRLRLPLAETGNLASWLGWSSIY